MAEEGVRTAPVYIYTHKIVSFGVPMEVSARFKRATFKLSCQTQAKRKKYRLTPIAFPHGNEPFNCKQNRFPHPRVCDVDEVGEDDVGDVCDLDDVSIDDVCGVGEM